MDEFKLIKLRALEISRLVTALEIMKDFQFTTLSVLMLLNSTRVSLQYTLDQATEDEEPLRLRLQTLDGPDAEKYDSDELARMRTDYEAAKKSFYSKEYEVGIHPVKLSDFPDDREKFGKKILPSGRAIDYVNGFLDLIGTVIL